MNSCKILARLVTVAALCLTAGVAMAQGGYTPPYQSSDPKMQQAVDDLVAANRILAHAGLVPSSGHVSMRSPLDPSRVLMSRSLAPALVTARDIVELDLDCNQVPGAPKALLYQERFIHCAIFKARPDVGGVVHDHSPSAIAFGVSKFPLRPVLNAGRVLGFEGPPVHDISTVKGITNNLIASPEAGASLAAKLGKGSVVLMRGHGVAVAAAGVRQVVNTAIAVELNSQILLQAHSLGTPITYLNPANYGNEKLAREIGEEGRAWNVLRAEAMGDVKP